MKIKGFDENLCCRGYQFEVGKEYKIDSNNLELCTDTVFHYCDSLKNVNDFYPVTSNNRYCEIEVLGEEIFDDERKKFGSNHIRILREIVGEELNELKGLNSGNTGYWNTGNRNTGDCNTGNRNTGHRNTGHYNTGDCNTGDRNTGHCNTGDRNTGHYNTGNRNTGDCNTRHYNTGNRNTGDCNTGDRNTGDCNTGNRNTGHCNTGDRNTGDWNVSNNNTGCFMTEERTIDFFNKPSNMRYNDWMMSAARNLLNTIPRKVVEWIDSSDMTDEEKETYPTHTTTGGYLKVLDEKDVAQGWWNNLSENQRKVILSIPNFDAEIFKRCTGIDVER